MNETLHTILTAAAELEIAFGKDGYNAASMMRLPAIAALGMSRVQVQGVVESNARLIVISKRHGGFTLTAAGRQALSEPVSAPAPVVAASTTPVLGYSSTDYRRTVDASKTLPVGSVFVSGGRQMVVTAHSASSWYLSHNRIEAEGLWDLDGCAVTYEYYRPAPVSEPVDVVAQAAPVAQEISATDAGEQATALVLRSGETVDVSAEEIKAAPVVYRRTGGQLGEALLSLHLLPSGALVAVERFAPYGDSSGPGGHTRMLGVDRLPERLGRALGLA